MRSSTNILRIATLVWLTITVAPSQAEPVLMVLEHTENRQPVETKVEAIGGITASPFKGKGLEKIKIMPGDGLAGNPQPNDITVELLRGAGTESAMVCAITVRYFRDKRGVWVPHYQLVENVLVARGPDGRFRPLNIAQGMPSLIVMTGTSLPNPEGFYPFLEFGLTNGMLQIDAWAVK